MNSRIPDEFLQAIPKTDLHLHLDGSLRLPTLIELAKKHRIKLPAKTEEGLRQLVFKHKYADLTEYLEGFAHTCAVMRDAESIERIAFELAEDNLAEGVRYIEVRYAPQLHIHSRLSLVETVRAVDRGLRRAQRHHNLSAAVRHGADVPFHFGIIVCALRCFTPAMSAYYQQLFQVLAHAPAEQIFATASIELARAAVHLVREEGLPIVGFDLAGAEAGFAAEVHRAAFQYCHSNFLKKTIHAGEAYGPESIFQAITDCYANRIGHGTWLFAHPMIQDSTIHDRREYCRLLAEYIASQRITIEVCLTSNIQTNPRLRALECHPLRQMLDREMSITLCTDNRLVSHTTVTDEHRLAVRYLKLSPAELRNVVMAGFKGSFFPGTYREKRDYVRRVLDRYDALATSYRLM